MCLSGDTELLIKQGSEPSSSLSISNIFNAQKNNGKSFLFLNGAGSWVPGEVEECGEMKVLVLSFSEASRLKPIKIRTDLKHVWPIPVIENNQTCKKIIQTSSFDLQTSSIFHPCYFFFAFGGNKEPYPYKIVLGDFSKELCHTFRVRLDSLHGSKNEGNNYSDYITLGNTGLDGVSDEGLLTSTG